MDYLAPESSFDWAGFCAGLPALLGEHGTDLRLRLEPGRYVSASCGWYLMEVLDLKRSHGAWFAIARGGTHHFRTPAAQAHDHPFRVLRGARTPVLRDTPVTLVGQLCTPRMCWHVINPSPRWHRVIAWLFRWPAPMHGLFRTSTF